MAGVQRFYAEVGQVKAKFRQEVVNATFGRNDTSDGTLCTSRSRATCAGSTSRRSAGQGHARQGLHLQRQRPVRRRLREQAGHQEGPEEEPPADRDHLPLRQGRPRRRLHPGPRASGKYGGKTDLVLRLVPKASSAQYKTLHLVVDRPTTGSRSRSSSTPPATRTTSGSTSPTFGAAIEDASFQFSEKSPKVKAFRVIDGDQEADKQNAPPSAPTTPTP
jgi:hypothetical protein